MERCINTRNIYLYPLVRSFYFRCNQVGPVCLEKQKRDEIEKKNEKGKVAHHFI